jgi:hypothetical protein
MFAAIDTVSATWCIARPGGYVQPDLPLRYIPTPF